MTPQTAPPLASSGSASAPRRRRAPFECAREARMYAVIQTGGKQYRVAEGDKLDVELLGSADVTLTPVLLVDGDTVLSTPSALSGATVTARVVGRAKGPKIKGFTY